MRVAVTGAGGPARQALVRALEDAPFTGPPGRSPGRRGPSTSTRPRRSASASTATGPRSSSTPRPGPTSTAAPAIRTSRCAATRSRPGVLARACAARGVDLLVVSTNEVFDGARTDGAGYGPHDRAEPRQTLRRLEAGRRAGGGRGVRRGRQRQRGAAGRSASPGRRGCSGRPAATSRARSSTPPNGRRGRRAAPRRSATSGGRRPTARTSPRRSSSCWPTTRRRDPPSRQRLVATPADWARDVLERMGRPRRRARGRPGGDLDARPRHRRAGACWRRRRCRAANRCGPGPARWPTTRRRSCARAWRGA